MENKNAASGPVMRLFRAKTKSGCAERLIQSFATTSADVVQNEPGNQGYCFGPEIGHDQDTVIFASFWSSLSAVKHRFGDKWKESHLPDGYGDLIEEHTLTHVDLSTGWNIK